MGFFAMYLLHGALLAGPIDRSGFPVIIQTDWEERTSIGDQWERMELIGADRIRISRGLFNGFEHPDADTAFSELRLDSQDRILSDCVGRGCDYRQEGREYRYGPNGQVVKTFRYRDGTLRDSVEFIFKDGHNVGIANGALTLTWTGNDLIAKKLTISPQEVLTSAYTYNGAHDTITHHFHNPIGDPNDGMEVYALAAGRPVSRRESDSSGLFSTRTYRYAVPATLQPPEARATVRSAMEIDPLGRRMSRPGKTQRPAFPFPARKP